MIEKSAIFALDKIMRNNIQYERILVPTTTWVHRNYFSHIHSRTHITDERPKTRAAWVYLACPDVWNVNGETWEPLFWYSSRKNYKPPYYFFNTNPNRRNQSQT